MVLRWAPLLASLALLAMACPSQECSGLPAGPIFPIHDALRPPKVIDGKIPPIPEEAERLGAQGKVVLALVIQTNGQVAALSVLRHAGMGLDELAVEAARNWRFEPAQVKVNKIPVAVSATIDVWFHAALTPHDELAVRRIEFPFLGKYSRPIAIRYRPIPWAGKRKPGPETLVVTGTVNQLGKLQQLQITHGLDEQTNLEALQALKSWSFRPAYDGDLPREAEVRLEFAPPRASQDEAESLHLRSASALVAGAEVLRQQGRTVEARDAVLKAKELLPFSILADYLHGQILLDMKQPAEAIAPLLVAMKRMPFDADVYALIGRAYEEIGLHTTAVAYLSCAVRLRPDWPDFWEARSAYRHQAGDETGSQADLLAARKLRDMRERVTTKEDLPAVRARTR